ncbi:hypothetical protein KFE25_013671 [Diacronema lutheri]|uniref:Uncharacterized protein n=1 Tax=Diacronema lutheri TaxID=2081491 RepID=A0A8J5XJ36_DIALT|nr:hypothetical protein KFE25_013671 [Diacronema lutheri]
MEEPGVWRKRSRPFVQPTAPPLERGPEAPVGFVVEASTLPAFSLMHRDDDQADGEELEDMFVGSTALALGLDVSLPGMSDDCGPKRKSGLAALLFDMSGNCFAGVCLLARGEIVRLCGRVLQSFDCTADCCKRALIKVRVELESDAGRMPMQTVLAKSELNLGDFWNWRSPICSFSTEVVVSDEGMRVRLVDAHFSSLAEHENVIGTSGIVCVGPMHILVDLPAPTERGAPTSDREALSEGAWPPDSDAGVAALLTRHTRCSWRSDMQWLGQGRHFTRNGSAHGGSASNSARESTRAESDTLLSPSSPASTADLLAPSSA